MSKPPCPCSLLGRSPTSREFLTSPSVGTSSRGTSRPLTSNRTANTLLKRFPCKPLKETAFLLPLSILRSCKTGQFSSISPSKPSSTYIQYVNGTPTAPFGPASIGRKRWGKPRPSTHLYQKKKGGAKLGNHQVILRRGQVTAGGTNAAL
jgi:hypothetical protein